MGNKKMRDVTNATDSLNTDNIKQVIEALNGDIASRDANGDPKVGGGRIGNDDYGFNNAFLISGIKITGDPTTTEYLSSDTFTVPADINAIKVVVGGAGTYASSAISGAGGGTAIAWIPTTPGEVYTITISSGSATFSNATLGTILSATPAASISSGETNRPGKGSGLWYLFPLLVAGGRGNTSPYHSQGTIFAPCGDGGGGAYSAGATAGGGFTAASGSTPGVAGASITYYN